MTTGRINQVTTATKQQQAVALFRNMPTQSPESERAAVRFQHKCISEAEILF
jgi:hypothetical protein